MSPQTNDPFLIHVSHRDIDDGKKTPITRYDVLFLFRSNTNTRATSPRHAFIDDTNATTTTTRLMMMIDRDTRSPYVFFPSCAKE